MFSLINAREKRNYVNFILISEKKSSAGFIEDAYKGPDGIPVNFLLSFLYCYFHYNY